MSLPNSVEVPLLFGDSDRSLCLKPFCLYEAIVIIKWPDSDLYNASSMGIRFIDEYTIILNPYPSTDTFNILNQYLRDPDNKERKKFTINLIDNPVYYAKTALKGENKGNNVQELKMDELIEVEDGNCCFLKDTNIGLLVELVSDLKDFKFDFSDKFSDYKNQKVKMKFTGKFELNILKKFRSNRYFQPTSRGNHLAIEAITLASKLPAMIKLAESKEKSSKRDADKIFKMFERVRFYEKEIRRFSADKNALDACILIDEFLNSLF